MLQCVAVCCSVLQGIDEKFDPLDGFYVLLAIGVYVLAVCGSVLQRVAVCCSVLQCAVVCCMVLCSVCSVQRAAN